MRLENISNDINAIYFCPNVNHEFSQVTEFIEKTVKAFNIRMQIIQADWTNGVATFLQNLGDTNAQECQFIIGCRKSDGKSDSFKAIDSGKVANFTFARIHPILNWNYGDVWNFIRVFGLDYCSLYDLGYTSLGGKNDTDVNPYLEKNSDGTYCPAYTLENWNHERAGRNKNPI
ncbi:bifunctional Rossmann-like alpha-beta-alpha sandwich fold/Phosphoadenosine phosphosulfate reductase [Babesia duncani]|uniref:FAD synthase n=1 Tax=Babesia duncani TaxID=323732 RepID=A0AAD9PNE4_9APIC|nr:bifunctional Rossmann-like alpha-beta-alpha sandwich fold/Phosphoadenosine phosphosulfate reductase [Babesia duncani]